MKFIELINNTKCILDEEMCIEKNLIFAERYTKMKTYLQKLEEAYKLGKMNKSSICLNIVRMLNHGDSEQLVDSVTNLNHYYQEYIYQEKNGDEEK